MFVVRPSSSCDLTHGVNRLLRHELTWRRVVIAGNFPCTVCGKVFCHSSSLSRHRMQAHFKSYTCTLCNQEISSELTPPPPFLARCLVPSCVSPCVGHDVGCCVIWGPKAQVGPTGFAPLALDPIAIRLPPPASPSPEEGRCKRHGCQSRGPGQGEAFFGGAGLTAAKGGEGVFKGVSRVRKGRAALGPLQLCRRISEVASAYQ